MNVVKMQFKFLAFFLALLIGQTVAVAVPGIYLSTSHHLLTHHTNYGCYQPQLQLPLQVNRVLQRLQPPYRQDSVMEEGVVESILEGNLLW